MEDFIPQQNTLNNLNNILPQFCDKCGTRYMQENIEMISQQQDKFTCKIQCGHCGNGFIMSINSPFPGAYAARRDPFRSEISSTEIKKFMAFDKIRPDDIISVFDKLKTVNTISDFNKLIKEAEEASKT